VLETKKRGTTPAGADDPEAVEKIIEAAAQGNMDKSEERLKQERPRSRDSKITGRNNTDLDELI